MRILTLGLIFASFASVAFASIPTTGRSSYGTSITAISVACSPSANCNGEAFNSSNFSSDNVYAYQVIGTGDFQLELESTSASLAGDTNTFPAFGAFTGNESGTAYVGQDPSAIDSYACGTLGCSPSNTGFDIIFTAQDSFDAACTSFTPMNSSSQSCGLVFFVVEPVGDAAPTATVTVISGSPEPASIGLMGAGALGLAALLSVRRNRRYCA